MNIDEALRLAEEYPNDWANSDVIRALADEVERLRAQANCGAGHDPERICCAHAADVERLRGIAAAARVLAQEDAPSWFGPAIDKLRATLGEG